MSSLAFYVIYERPADFPEHYVVRRWILKPDENNVMQNYPDENILAKADTLEEVRQALPYSVVNIHRFPNDDPKIKEVWV